MSNTTDTEYMIKHAIIPILTVLCMFCSCVGVYCYKNKNKDKEEYVKVEQRDVIRYYTNTSVMEL